MIWDDMGYVYFICIHLLSTYGSIQESGISSGLLTSSCFTTLWTCQFFRTHFKHSGANCQFCWLKI